MKKTGNSRPPHSRVRMFLWIGSGWKLLGGKLSGLLRSVRLSWGFQTLRVPKETRNRLKEMLVNQTPMTNRQSSKEADIKCAPTIIPQSWASLPEPELELELEPLSGGSSPTPAIESKYAADSRLIEQIHRETVEANRNNLTRTAAYLEIYRLHPELHWAFLAHMVSRSAGYSMTDLKGEFLPRILPADKREAIFGMLEQANALIFQDAFPQLVLYRESRRAGRSLFHHLSAFGVSSFMLPFWDAFCLTGSPVSLTIALIVNEQNYIQGRVVENPSVRQQVLDTPLALLQRLLQLNQIIFPYSAPSPRHPSLESRHPLPALAGIVLENFSDLQERIDFGRKLYAILFGIPGISDGVFRFAERTLHTGSRADYWPLLFSDKQTAAAPNGRWTEKLKHTGLLPGSEPLFSPVLEAVWPDHPLEEPRRYDWYEESIAKKEHLHLLRHFRPVRPPVPVDITFEHAFAFKKQELAVLTKELPLIQPLA